MKALVTGGSGMLGKEVVGLLQSLDIEHIAPSHQELDISDIKAIKICAESYRPSLIINCAGIVKQAVADFDRLTAVNSIGPIYLSIVADLFNARLVHISTDCVFSGRNGPYSEWDRCDAVDDYGLSKSVGEITTGKHLTIRSSFIGFGKYGLLEWALKQTGIVKGYTNSYWNGLTSKEFAKHIVALSLIEEFTGIVHIGTQHIISKAELLEIIQDVFGLDYKVEHVDAPLNMKGNKALCSCRLSMDLPSIESMLYDIKYSRVERQVPVLHGA